MQKYKNLYLIGSSHISKQSVEEIKKTFEKIEPDIIALELDKQRAYALMSKKQGKISIYDIRRIGFKGFIFAVIASWASKKLGKMVNMMPGTEMKTAIILARKNKKQLAFIDQHVEITLKRFSKALSWKERWRFLADIFNGLILRKKHPLLKKFDLRKVPGKKVIKEMMNYIKQRYPNIHKVLVTERNYFMARRLKRIMKEHPDEKILAVVGAGHEEDILKILKDNEGVSYSFTYSI